MIILNSENVDIYYSKFINNISTNNYGGGLSIVGNMKTNFTLFETSIVGNTYKLYIILLYFI